MTNTLGGMEEQIHSMTKNILAKDEGMNDEQYRLRPQSELSEQRIKQMVPSSASKVN